MPPSISTELIMVTITKHLLEYQALGVKYCSFSRHTGAGVIKIKHP